MAIDVLLQGELNKNTREKLDQSSKMNLRMTNL